ncbi:hypothetical protein CSC70_01935 [Pseudoxanthomonas kalamensis DSM 18571]|uniref:DUF6882 domain-containing protein n=1 Tax=Pseudoxanthomonas kalamensis TaxID=289483 RepID=UPI0013913015|nr:DUF6882 domain-containing protein [Pseudoxanthomonas kalamensis]KAF1712308.1 hypothetical protein CSC70_01935 [Pseudoxanthomonas kalamensis DSM 18571]
MDKRGFGALLQRHIGTAFARQLALSDLVEGEGGYDLDLHENALRFGDRLKFPVQLLGTESEGDHSWLWAWANTASQLPPELLQASLQLRDLGVRDGIAELSERTFPTTIANGHQLSLLASGVVGNACYYRAPYVGGALYLLIQPAPEEVLLPATIERCVSVIPQVISMFEVDHRAMITAFLTDQGFKLKSTTDTLIARRDNSIIDASFDATGRLNNLKGILAAPAGPPAKKPWYKFW